MEPNITITGNPIDYELAKLLGEKPADFVALFFDGVQFKSFGTPFDSPRARREKQILVDHLNDRSKNSWWPEIFESWSTKICEQYGLPPETTAKDYRPVVSWEIVRVVHGYSQHRHCAIRLFEMLDAQIKTWSCRKCEDGKHIVEIITTDNYPIINTEEELPMAICKAMIRVLKRNSLNR